MVVVQRSVSRAAVFAVEGAQTMACVCIATKIAVAAEGCTQSPGRLTKHCLFYDLDHDTISTKPKYSARR